ncbi:hypothetical protein [Wenjunlia tyrosinilytica]|uniref:Uncharacterized protein n=1 Tax=Wenjunlia tyrosinilytica TaxID=1544741 RepID=A0A917ZFT5_9ACTN|nr:hypothetical protein [Wenjunlia tyrosinilytica]GGO81953.1 hypothetical protein GCM10012280_07440 [Wenjunlia tyrosinilytica]
MPEERDERDRGQEEEDAVWQQLVASFDDEPAEDASWPEAEGLAEDDDFRDDDAGDDDALGFDNGVNTTRSIVIATGPVHKPSDTGPRELGPRDFEPDEEDEGHFVPPPPPPLPKLDTTSKFAWLAVLGGPLLLFVMVLLRQEITWWMTTLGVGGFLGGFATLVARMGNGDEDEDDDPHGGAVV